MDTSGLAKSVLIGARLSELYTNVEPLMVVYIHRTMAESDLPYTAVSLVAFFMHINAQVK